MANRIVGYRLEGESPIPVYSQDYAACRRFAEWLQDACNRDIECTPIRPGLFVTTSFLGINRARYPSKELLLWESRVIRDGSAITSYLYSFAADARAGHWELVYCLFRNERLPIPPHVLAQIEAHVPLAYRCPDADSTPQGETRALDLVNS